MKNVPIIRIAGIYNFICAACHVAFPRMLMWSDILATIQAERRPLVENPLYIMNWCMTVLWIILGILFLKYPNEIRKPGIGRTLLALMVLFWIIRIFVLQPYYIGIAAPTSWQMVCFFIVGLILYAVPLVRSMRSAE